MQPRNKRTNIITKTIDNIFDTAREVVRHATGFTKASSQPYAPKALLNRRRQRANRKKYGRIPRFPTETATNKYRYAKQNPGFKYETRIIDYIADIKIREDTGDLLWGTNTNTLDLPTVHTTDEFKSFAADWTFYKIHSVRFTFDPIASGTATTNDTMIVPQNYPCVRFEMMNSRCNDMGYLMNYNANSLILDPNGTKPQVFTAKFNNQMIFPVDLLGDQPWALTTLSYFTSTINPKFKITPSDVNYKVIPYVDLILFRVHIQIKVVGAQLDGKTQANLKDPNHVQNYLPKLAIPLGTINRITHIGKRVERAHSQPNHKQRRMETKEARNEHLDQQQWLKYDDDYDPDFYPDQL